MRTLDKYIEQIPQVLIAIQNEMKSTKFCSNPYIDYLYLSYQVANNGQGVLIGLKITLDELMTAYNEDKDSIERFIPDSASDYHWESWINDLNNIVRFVETSDYYLIGVNA